MRVYQTLFQTVLLALTLIGVIIYQNNPNENDDSSCWENKIGQELYRLLILFFFGIIILSLIMETIYKFIQPWLSCMRLEPPEFDISQNTMLLIYGQTLTWFAIYYR